MAVESARRKRHTQFLLGGILPIDQKRIPVDVIAGATLAALAIPEVMGYAKIAGTPVITGLYTLILPVALFALFGSSRHLVVGADSATAAILAVGLLATGAVAGSPEYTQLASLAALMCAVLPGPRAAPAARLHRQLPVAQRAHRLPDRRRASRWPWASSAACSGSPARAGPRSRSSGRPCRRSRRRPACPTLVVSLAVLGHDPRPRAGQQEDPGRARSRSSARSSPATSSTSPPGASPTSAPSPAACPRSACRRT